MNFSLQLTSSGWHKFQVGICISVFMQKSSFSIFSSVKYIVRYLIVHLFYLKAGRGRRAHLPDFLKCSRDKGFVHSSRCMHRKMVRMAHPTRCRPCFILQSKVSKVVKGFTYELRRRAAYASPVHRFAFRKCRKYIVRYLIVRYLNAISRQKKTIRRSEVKPVL